MGFQRKDSREQTPRPFEPRLGAFRSVSHAPGKPPRTGQPIDPRKWMGIGVIRRSSSEGERPSEVSHRRCISSKFLRAPRKPPPQVQLLLIPSPHRARNRGGGGVHGTAHPPQVVNRNGREPQPMTVDHESHAHNPGTCSLSLRTTSTDGVPLGAAGCLHANRIRVRFFFRE